MSKQVFPDSPGRGMIAICSIGQVGIITVDKPEEITYTDGSVGVAWIGYNVVTGEPWSSRNPKVIGYAVEV